MLNKIKTIKSYTELARFVAGVSEEPVGYLARSDYKDIPSPYHYSPVKPVYGMGDKKKVVFWVEVTHRVFEVFEVTEGTPIYANEKRAEEANVRAFAALMA